MIWVDPYWRIRDGVSQHVRGHWRRRPRKRSATLVQFPHPPAA